MPKYQGQGKALKLLKGIFEFLVDNKNNIYFKALTEKMSKFMSVLASSLLNQLMFQTFIKNSTQWLKKTRFKTRFSFSFGARDGVRTHEPAVYGTAALPTELPEHILVLIF